MPHYTGCAVLCRGVGVNVFFSACLRRKAVSHSRLRMTKALHHISVFSRSLRMVPFLKRFHCEWGLHLMKCFFQIYQWLCKFLCSLFTWHGCQPLRGHLALTPLRSHPHRTRADDGKCRKSIKTVTLEFYIHEHILHHWRCSKDTLK